MSKVQNLIAPPECDTPSLPSSDMQLLECCCPGCGRLCGTLHLCLAGEVLIWRGSRPPVPLTGTTGMSGTCLTSSYTFYFALLCPSLSLSCLTHDSCGPSARWAMWILGSQVHLIMKILHLVAWTIIVIWSFCLDFDVLGDQAAGVWSWQHKSCGGPGGTYGSSDGVGLLSNLAAICCYGPCCHHGLQSLYWPHRRYHTRLLG